jgi:hypothetical protein
MSGRFAHIARCLDVREADFTEALRERSSTLALLGHLASISSPNTGAAKVLLAYARMATTACDWIDGDLSIEVVGGEDATVIEATTDLGGGLRERLFAPFTFRAPMEEFARAIDRVPHMIVPLVMRARSSGRLSLSATAAVRRTSAPPPPIEISAESLFVHPASSALPRVFGEAAPPRPVGGDDVDGGWED